MMSLTVIFLLLIAIQKAISFIFGDFPYISVVLQQLLGIFIPPFVYCKIIKKQAYVESKDFKIKSYDIFPLLFAGFFMQVFGSFVSYPVSLLLANFNLKTATPSAISEIKGPVLYIFLVCFIPAFTEELLFRKLAFQKISEYGKKCAVALTAILFGLIHFNPYSLVPLILAGLAMGYVCYEGFPVIYTMIFHFSLNFSGLLLDFITKSEKANEIINNYFLLIGILSGFFVFSFLLYIKKRSKEEFLND